MIFFYYELGKKKGFGHQSRCMAINQRLKKIGMKTYYLNLGNKKIENKNFGKNIFYKKDLNKIINFKKILIIDSYNINQKKINFYKKYFKYIFLINDVPVKNIKVYGIINPNNGNKLKDYNQEVTKLFLGIKYKFIRDFKLPEIKKESGITISFGAGNVYKRVKKYLLTILKFLNKINFKEEINIFIDLNKKEKRELLKHSKIKITINNISQKFINRAHSSKFVISSMGLQFDELCKLKKPSFFLKIAENQSFNYNISKKYNCQTTHDLENYNEKKIIHTLKLLMEKSQRYKIVQNYSKFILGNNIDEVINYFNKLIKN